MVSDFTNNFKWSPRESHVIHIDFMEHAIFASLPHNSSWNVCNIVYYNDIKHILYMSLVDGEEEPYVYNKNGDKCYINSVWNKIKYAIVTGEESEYIHNV